MTDHNLFFRSKIGRGSLVFQSYCRHFRSFQYGTALGTTVCPSGNWYKTIRTWNQVCLLQFHFRNPDISRSGLYIEDPRHSDHHSEDIRSSCFPPPSKNNLFLRFLQSHVPEKIRICRCLILYLHFCPFCGQILFHILLFFINSFSNLI